MGFQNLSPLPSGQKSLLMEFLCYWLFPAPRKEGNNCFGGQPSPTTMNSPRFLRSLLLRSYCFSGGGTDHIGHGALTRCNKRCRYFSDIAFARLPPSANNGQEAFSNKELYLNCTILNPYLHAKTEEDDCDGDDPLLFRSSSSSLHRLPFSSSSVVPLFWQ